MATPRTRPSGTALSPGNLAVTTPARRFPADWVASGYTSPCPVRALFDRIGDTWSVLVLLRLGDGQLRFRQLHRALSGISTRMLAQTLRDLECAGLVVRTVLPTRPPGAEYVISSLGRSLLVPLTALSEWAMANQQVMAQQARRSC